MRQEDAGDAAMVLGAIFLDAVVGVVAEIENQGGLPFFAEHVDIGDVGVTRLEQSYFHLKL